MPDAKADFITNVNLIAQIFMYIILCLGIVAQRKQKYGIHDLLQTPVVIFNLFFIFLAMFPSFRAVSREIPARLSETYILVPTIHIILGALAEGFAIYCLLAGHQILPRKIGVLRYFMWATFVLWTAAVMFGIGTYLIWYTDIGGRPNIALVLEHNADLSQDPAQTLTSEDPSPTLTATAALETVDKHAAAPIVEPTPIPIESMMQAEENFILDWEQLVPTNAGPGPRYEHTMVYNPANGQAYLFGGRDDDAVYNDLWALDLDALTWRELGLNTPNKPNPRYSTVLTIDQAGQTLYLATGQEVGGDTLNDIWQFDLATETWQNLSPNAGPPPTTRYGNPGGTINGNLVVTHGFGGGTRHNDTWIFNTKTRAWENITPAGDLPLNRCLFAADTANNNLVMHGGCASGFGPCYLDDTWILEAGGAGWRELITDIKPSGRQHHSLTSVQGKLQFLLFGGQDANQTALNDLWLLDLNTETWQALDIPNGPAPRYNHSAIWLPDRGLLLYGGRNSGPALDELWLLNVEVEAGSEAPPVGSPTQPPVDSIDPDLSTPAPPLLIDEHDSDEISEHDGE